MTATIGVSSSMGTTQQGKRKKCPTLVQHSKRQRHSHGVPNGVAPLQAAGMAFPITGVSGAAARWSTAAALGAAGRAAALPLPVRVGAKAPGLKVASVNGVATASTPQMVTANGVVSASARQVATANGGATASAPQTAIVNGVATASAPLVFAHATGQGQLVPVPVQFYGYMPTVAGPTGATLLPLAAALNRFHSATLARLLSVLMAVCHPPVRQHESRSGAPPRWWPTASEWWWAAEVVAHVPRIPTPVPFVGAKLLKKAHRVAVLVAMVKHLAPDFGRIAAAVRRCGMSGAEAALWSSALQYEQARCGTPVYVVHLQQHGGNHLLPLIAVTDGVTPPPHDGGLVVVAAAEQLQEEHGGGGGVAPFDDGYQQVADDGGAHIGAIVATPAEEVHDQVAPAAEAEPEKPQQPEQGTVFSPSGSGLLEDMLLPFPVAQAHDLHHPANHSGKDVLLSGSAAAEAQEEPPEDRRPWYENQELRRVFAGMPIGSPHSFDDGWFF